MSVDVIRWDVAGPVRGRLHDAAGRRQRGQLHVAQPRAQDRRRAGQRGREPPPPLRRGRSASPTALVELPAALRDRAAGRPRREGAGDGLWTDAQGEAVLAAHRRLRADRARRAPTARPAVAVLHAGWRGLLAGIVAAGVEALGPGPLAAAVGPSIGPCCYEVGAEVAEPFGADVMRGRNLDLWAAAGARAPRGRRRADRADRPLHRAATRSCSSRTGATAGSPAARG